ncbi:MAG TPA: BsuBI/PstI family type II restriction endonuclease [Thiobacillaceae bacterium]|nr:BsuBI/PstI family type II restriction endonuclease [Thiobacillaceae bacterium]
MSERGHIEEALDILVRLGLPRAQQNDRSALCLLALLDLAPGGQWKQAGQPLLGITPIMDWAKRHYGADYAPNTRETFRRQTMHQFVAAGIALRNPDKPDRPTNSPDTVYQLAPELLALLKTYGGRGWAKNLAAWLTTRPSLSQRYAKARNLERVPVRLGGSRKLELSPGAHSRLIRAIIEDFAPRFAPGSTLIYAGDTGRKWGYFDQATLTAVGVTGIDVHGKMPDVVLHDTVRDWLLLVESVTSHGPVDGKRHEELSGLFANSRAGLVFVTAFPDKATYKKYAADIAWETEVWIADAPEHLIHFNGSRFLGPY